MSERFMDLGSKVLISVISLLLGVIMTLTFQQARYAVELAHANEVRIKALEISTANIKEMLNEIRLDVKKLIERTG